MKYLTVALMLIVSISDGVVIRSLKPSDAIGVKSDIPKLEFD